MINKIFLLTLLLVSLAILLFVLTTFKNMLKITVDLMMQVESKGKQSVEICVRASAVVSFLKVVTV